MALAFAASSGKAWGQPNGLPTLPRGGETLWNADAFPVWPFPGDANRDGSIDQRDLDKVMADMGQTGRLRVPKYFGSIGDGIAFGNLWSDFNGDQVVDGADLSIVAAALLSGTTAGLPIRGSDGAIDFSGSEFGLALVWPEQPAEIPTGSIGPLLPNKPLRAVLLTGLGVFDRVSGERIGSNAGRLDGKYLTTEVRSLQGLPEIPRATSASNDFRVDLMAQSHPWPREHVAWQSEASLYFDITEWRRRSMNGPFLTRLALDPIQRARLERYQGVEGWLAGQTPGGCEGVPCLSRLPKIVVEEPGIGGPPANAWVDYRTLEMSFYFMMAGNGMPVRWSTAWPGWVGLYEYPTVVSQWLVGLQLPDEATFMVWAASEARGCSMGDAIPAWTNMLLEGHGDRGYGSNYTMSQYCATAGGIVAQTLRPCLVDRSDSVMIQDYIADGRISTSRNGVYPPAVSNQVFFPPGTMDYGAWLFNGLFYDLATEAGMGLERANLLYWRALANSVAPILGFPNSAFGDAVGLRPGSCGPIPARRGRACTSRMCTTRW